MIDIEYRLNPSLPQFKWFVSQLRASKAVIDLSLEHAAADPANNKKSLFNVPLATLRLWTKGASDNLSTYVNNGMQGMSLSNISDPIWQKQFRYRATGKRGIKQYPNGDIYLPPVDEDHRLVLPDAPLDETYPITSLIFRLNTPALEKPYWSVLVHRNTRPPMPYIKRRPKVMV